MKHKNVRLFIGMLALPLLPLLGCYSVKQQVKTVKPRVKNSNPSLIQSKTKNSSTSRAWSKRLKYLRTKESKMFSGQSPLFEIHGKGKQGIGKRCIFVARCPNCCWRSHRAYGGMVDTGLLEKKISKSKILDSCLRITKVVELTFRIHLSNSGQVISIKAFKLISVEGQSEIRQRNRAVVCLRKLLYASYPNYNCERVEYIKWTPNMTSLLKP